MEASDELEENGHTQKMKSILAKVSCVLNETTFTSINELLEKADINEAEYNLALQCSTKGTTVVSKRRTNEVFINYYNEFILKAWKANMDIQENM